MRMLKKIAEVAGDAAQEARDEGHASEGQERGFLVRGGEAVVRASYTPRRVMQVVIWRSWRWRIAKGQHCVGH